MQYLLNKTDTFTEMVLRMEFGTAEPNLELDFFGKNPVIKLLPIQEKRFYDNHLLLNHDVGTWCILNKNEYKVFNEIFNAESGKLTIPISKVKNGDLSEFLVMLYIRGILSINDETFISGEIFDDGPIGTSNPLFIVVPSDKCNFLCSYCFACADNSFQKTMTIDTFDRAIDKIAQLDFSNCSIEFAGGEALMCFDFIKDALPRAREKLNASGKSVEFTMQTNGSLINKEVIDFVKLNNLGIGISLDGYEEMNDLTRKFPDGSGTYKKIRESIELLQSENVRCGIILVLSKKNKDNVVQLMEHFSEIGFSSVKMNPIYNLGRANSDWGALALEPETFLEAHKNYLDYVFDNEFPVVETNTQMLINNLSSMTRAYRCMISTCGAGTNHLTFTPDGGIYPCSRYRFDSNFCMGNVHDDINLEGLCDKNDNTHRLKGRTVSKVPECSQCTYRRFCEGGCSMDSHHSSGSWTSVHPWCVYYAGVYEELFKRLCEDIFFVEKLTSRVWVYSKNFFSV